MAVLVGLGNDWECKGLGLRDDWEYKGSLPKVTVSPGSGSKAPESQSCAGASSPILLLLCNFSKYRSNNFFPE